MFLLRLAPAPEKVEGIWRRPPARGVRRDSFFSDRRDGPCSQRGISGAARPTPPPPGKFVGALNRNQDSWCKWLVGRRAGRLFTKKYRVFGLLRETEPGYTAMRY